MKLKIDFVTNSSSASFTILKHYLSDHQVEKIKNHLTESEKIIIHRGPQNQIWNDKGSEWDITETDKEIQGWTSMDNFDMWWFLGEIGVDSQHIEYEHNG